MLLVKLYLDQSKICVTLFIQFKVTLEIIQYMVQSSFDFRFWWKFVFKKKCARVISELFVSRLAHFYMHFFLSIFFLSKALQDRLNCILNQFSTGKVGQNILSEYLWYKSIEAVLNHQTIPYEMSKTSTMMMILRDRK